MTTRFCPLHGDYAGDGESTQCPECRHDPIGSSVSMRQVKVVSQDHESMSEPDSELTPIADVAPCPICGNPTPLEDFRSESIGEIWTGKAAEFAEEGVCQDCYRDVVADSLRSWSDNEWLAHHYEGWRSSLQQIHDIFAFEESPHESWLPAEERSKILSVEKTLEQRKAHLQRSHSAMLELLGKHNASITAPPFQMSMATAREAVSAAAVAALHQRREEDLEAEAMRRQDSVVAKAPVEEPAEMVELQTIGGTTVKVPVRSPSPSPSRGFSRGLLIGALIIAAVVAVVLLSR